MDMLREGTYYGQTDLWKSLYLKSSEGKTFKNLMPLILAYENIMLAYRMVKTNKGAETPGVDRTTIRQIKRMGADRLVEIVRDKLTGKTPYSAVKRKFIPKANGKLRPLGIPAIADRIAEQAIRQVLEPIYEAKFYKHSYGYRPGLSQQDAIETCTALVVKGYTHAVDFDITGYFDNVDHTILLRILWNDGIRDKRVLSAIKAILKRPISGEGIPVKGTPQGGVISPLLANIYLNELDKWVNDQWNDTPWIRNHRPDKNMARTWEKYGTSLKRGMLVRFADDFIILARNRTEAVRWFHATKEWLKKRLRLDYSQEKSKVVNLKRKSTVFLGYKLKAAQSRNNKGTYGKISMPEKKVAATAEKVKQKWSELSKTSPRNLREWYRKLSELGGLVRGIRNYYKICPTVYTDLARIDYLTYRARDKIWRNRPKLRPTLVKIYGANDQSPSEIGKLPQSVGLAWQQAFTVQKKVKRENVLLQDASNACLTLEYKALCWKLRYWTGPTEKRDIALSLYGQQRGRCSVCSDTISHEAMEIHRKVPGKLGGKYEFRNCVLVHPHCHHVIHGTKETLMRFILLFRLNCKRRKRLVRLWCMAHGVSN